MVNGVTLDGFYEALDAEEVDKHPDKVVKHTIAHWNMCRKAVSGWPDFKLASPFRATPYTLPLAAFPLSFQEDVSQSAACGKSTRLLPTSCGASTANMSAASARMR